MVTAEEQFVNKNMNLIRDIMYIEKNDKKSFDYIKSLVRISCNRVEKEKLKSQINDLIDNKKNQKLLNCYIKETFNYRDIDTIASLLNIDSIKASAKLYHNSFNIEEIRILILRYYNSFIMYLEKNGIDLEY